MGATIYLKVKLKALAAEARIIRSEEKKAKRNKTAIHEIGHPFGDLLINSLHHHRVVIVRREARATLWAYGYLRGRAFEQVERMNISMYNSDTYVELRKKTESMVRKYGTAEQLQALPNWFKGVK